MGWPVRPHPPRLAWRRHRLHGRTPELSWAASPARHLEDLTELFMNISQYILDVIILLRIN